MSRRTNLNTIRSQDGWGRWTELQSYASLVTLDNKINNYLIGLFYSLKMPTSYYVIRRFYSSLAIIEMDIVMYDFNRQRLFISSERLFYLVINRFRRWLRRFVTNSNFALNKWQLRSLVHKKKNRNKWQKPSSFRSKKKTRARTLLKYARRRLRKHRLHRTRRFLTKRRQKLTQKQKQKQKQKSRSRFKSSWRYKAKIRARYRSRSMSRSNYIRSLFSKQSGKESRKANAYKPRTTIEIRRLSRNAALFLRLSAMKTASCFFKKTRKRKLLCLLPRRVRSRFSRIRRSRRRIRRFTLFARSLCRTVRLYTRHLCSSVIRANMRRLSYMSSLVNVNAHVTPCSSTTQRVMSGPGPRKYPQLNMTQKRNYSRYITKKDMRTESVTLLEAREVFSFNFFASVYVHTTPRTKWQLIKASLLDGSVDCIFQASRIRKIELASLMSTCSEKTVTTSKYEEYIKVRATADFQWALCRHLSHKTPISDAISDAVNEFIKSCLALCICFMVYLLVVQVSITYYLMQLQVYLMHLQLPLPFFYSFDGQDLFMISRLIYLFFYMVGAVLLLVLLKKFVNVCYVAFGVRAMDDTVYTIFFVLGLVLCVTYFNMFAFMTEEQWSQSLLHMVVRGLEHFFMDKAPYIIVCGFISHVTRTIMGIINSQVSSMWQLCKYTIVFEIIFFMILPDAFFTYDFLLNNAIGSVELCIGSCVVSSIFYILLLLFSPSNLGSRSLSIVMPFITLGYIGVIFIVYDLFIGVAYTMNDAFQLHLSNGILYGMVIVCVLIIELGLIFFIVRFYSISYSIFASFSTNITLEAYIAALKGALRGDFEAYKLLKRDPAHAQVFYDVLKFDVAGLHNMSRFNPTYYLFVFFAHIFFDWWKVIPASGYVVRFIITFFVCHIFLFLPLVLFFL